jgi:hypothetical protein
MKIINEPIITSQVSLVSDIALDTIYLGNIVNFSIQLVFTGTFTGTFYLQCSNDAGKPLNPGKIAQTDTIVNWTDVTGSAQAVINAGNHTWNIENVGYLWVRVAYTHGTGTGALTSARFTAKGV